MLRQAIVGHFPWLRQVKRSALRVRDKVRGRAATRAYWTLCDQAMVSLGNFATGLLLARFLPPAQYGLWALLLETMLFFNSLQAALVIYPLTIHGAGPDRLALRRLASIAVLFTVLLAPLLCAGMVLAASAASVALIAASAMIFWQLQETLRRGLIAQMRLADCLWGDSISYLGQAIGIYLAHRAGVLSLQSAFLVVGITSALAMLVQAAQVGFGPFNWEDLRKLSLSHWRLGRWALLANLTRLITSLLLLWSLQRWHGATAMAEFAALVMLLKVTNPVGSGLGGLITPAVAQARHRDSVRQANRVGLFYTLFGTVLLLPYYLPLCLFPSEVLHLVFGGNSPYLRQAHLLWVVVLYFYMNYLSAVLSAWLMGLSESRANFLAQAVQVVAVLILAWPLTIWHGVSGTMIGGVITTGAAVIMTGWFLLRAGRVQVGEPSIAMEPALETGRGAPAGRIAGRDEQAPSGPDEEESLELIIVRRRRGEAFNPDDRGDRRDKSDSGRERGHGRLVPDELPPRGDSRPNPRPAPAS